MRLIIPRVLAVLLALTATALAQQPVPVTTAAIAARDVPVLLRAIGTVQANQSVLIRARVDGTLDQVFFREGQTVHPGDQLAQLDPRPYQAILDQALARKAADEAALASARQDMVRYTELAQSQVASRQKLDQIRAAALQAEAAVRGDDAAIAAAELNLGFTRIVSPVEGRVGLRQIDPGNYIRAADTAAPGLVTIAQIKPISLVFTLPQDQLASVREAMARGPLPVTAYSADNRRALAEGRLLTMDSTIDTTTGTIRLKATFPNEDEALWPGQFVKVRLRIDQLTGALTVPSIAVQHGAAGLYLFVVRDGTARVRPVRVVQDDDGVAVIAAADGSPTLAAGEQVVTQGQSRLTDGTRVEAAPPKAAS